MAAAAFAIVGCLPLQRLCMRSGYTGMRPLGHSITRQVTGPFRIENGERLLGEGKMAAVPRSWPATEMRTLVCMGRSEAMQLGSCSSIPITPPPPTSALSSFLVFCSSASSIAAGRSCCSCARLPLLVYRLCHQTAITC